MSTNFCTPPRPLHSSHASIISSPLKPMNLQKYNVDEDDIFEATPPLPFKPVFQNVAFRFNEPPTARLHTIITTCGGTIVHDFVEETNTSYNVQDDSKKSNVVHSHFIYHCYSQGVTPSVQLAERFRPWLYKPVSCFNNWTQEDVEKAQLTVNRMPITELVSYLNKHSEASYQGIKNALKKAYSKSTAILKPSESEQDVKFQIIHPLARVLSNFFPANRSGHVQHEHSMGTKAMNMTNASGTGRIDICIGQERSSKFLKQIYVVIEAKLASNAADHPQVIGELACAFFYNKLMQLCDGDAKVTKNFVTYALLMDGAGKLVLFVIYQADEKLTMLHSDELYFVTWCPQTLQYKEGMHFDECCKIFSTIVSGNNFATLYLKHINEQMSAMKLELEESEVKNAKLEQEIAKVKQESEAKNAKLEQEIAKLKQALENQKNGSQLGEDLAKLPNAPLKRKVGYLYADGDDEQLEQPAKIQKIAK